MTGTEFLILCVVFLISFIAGYMYGCAVTQDLLHEYSKILLKKLGNDWETETREMDEKEFWGIVSQDEDNQEGENNYQDEEMKRADFWRRGDRHPYRDED